MATNPTPAPAAVSTSGNLAYIHRGGNVWVNLCSTNYPTKVWGKRADGVDDWVLIEEGHQIYVGGAFRVISCNDFHGSTVLPSPSQSTFLPYKTAYTYQKLHLDADKIGTKDVDITVTAKVLSPTYADSLSSYSININTTNYGNLALDNTRSQTWNFSSAYTILNGKSREVTLAYIKTNTYYSGTEWSEVNVYVDFTVKVMYKNRVLHSDAWRVHVDDANGSANRYISRS